MLNRIASEQLWKRFGTAGFLKQQIETHRHCTTHWNRQMADNEEVILNATFDRNVRTYWLISGTIVMTLVVVTIPLIPIWLAIGYWATERYLQNMSCSLTNRSLKLRKGIFVRTEKTVPLDKITDLGFVQGPVMRALVWNRFRSKQPVSRAQVHWSR